MIMTTSPIDFISIPLFTVFAGFPRSLEDESAMNHSVLLLHSAVFAANLRPVEVTQENESGACR